MCATVRQRKSEDVGLTPRQSKDQSAQWTFVWLEPDHPHLQRRQTYSFDKERYVSYECSKLTALEVCDL